MQVNLKAIEGNWDAGYALDKHVLSSTYLGENEFGHAQFDTTRSEAGEALFQLKYRSDKNKSAIIAKSIFENITPKFNNIGLIIPLPASNARAWQPVTEISKELGALLKISVFEKILVKNQDEQGGQLKDMSSKEEKAAALAGKISLNDEIGSQGCWNALVVDDLFHTGASMEAACSTLRTYKKIDKIYVATVSWK